MTSGVGRLGPRATVFFLLAGPVAVALVATIAGLGPSFRLGRADEIERREQGLRAEFARVLERSAATAAAALAGTPARAFADRGSDVLGRRLEGVAVVGPDLRFLDWEGLPREPPGDFADPATPAWRVRVDGVRTRLLARAGPDDRGRLGLADYVIDSSLDDLDFLDLLSPALRGGLNIDVRFDDRSESVVGSLDRGRAEVRMVRLDTPSGAPLGTAKIGAVPVALRRATLMATARAAALVVFLLALAAGFRWSRLASHSPGLLAILAILATSRALLAWMDVPARLLPRALGAPGLYGSTAAWGLLESPADLLLSAAALYLALRALRAFCDPLAGRHRAGARALAAAGALLATAAAAGLADSMAHNTGLPLLGRPAPFLGDGRFVLWTGLLLALLGAAELWGWLATRAARRPPVHASTGGRVAVAIALLPLLLLAEVRLEREAERLALERLAHDYAPQVIEQEARRRVALVAAMHEIAESYRIADALARHREGRSEFLAYDAWVSGELFHSRFKSALDIYAPGGGLESHFGFDLPPLDESVAERLLADDGEIAVRSEVFHLGIGDERRLLHAEVDVVRGGKLVAIVVGHVLDEPDDLPFLPWSQPYFAALGPGSTDGAIPGGPDYVLYDALGSVVLTTMRRPPAAAEVRARQGAREAVELEIGDERFVGRALADHERLHLLLVPVRTAIERFATAIRLSLLGLALLAAFEGGSRLFRRGATANPLSLIRQSFYRKLVAAVLLASVPPLIGLALFLRGYIESRVNAELESSSLQYLSAARRVVADFEDFATESDADDAAAAVPDDVLLYWLRSVVGQEIHVYRGGTLQASSKRELFSSGLLPERLDGRVQRRLLDQGLPSVVQSAALGPLRIPVAYAPVRRGGDPSNELVVAVPLVVEREEIAEEAARVAEMILLATVLLVGLLVVTAALLARTVARPVRELVSATSRIAAGRYATRLEPRTRDEVAKLVRGFNAMATALGRQHADLERRRDYIETLLRHATTGVVSLDPLGRVVTLNPAAARLLDAAGPPALGRPLLAALRSSTALGPIADALAAGGSAHPGEAVDVDLPGRDPRRLRLVRVELSAAGDDVGTMILLDDVTDLMRSNQLAAWAEMARAIAHEIKNPLTPIQLSTEHLRRLLRDRGLTLGAEEEACLETILKQVRALYEIAGEFSTYARLPDLALEPTDPVAFVRGVVGPYRAANPRGVRIAESYETAPAVRIDSKVLSRAMINLIENALQAMEHGGTLTVAVRNGSEETVELRVSDTGHGLGPDVRQRLFEPYFSTKSSGTGLGLAIVRRAVEAHHGRILVDSRPGSGTTFTISLPA